MDTLDIETYVGRSRALDITGIAWDAVRRYPLPVEAVRTLRYMQDIESHTIVYLRELLATRIIDDPSIATFLACWIYEETFHGRALALFLNAAGYDVVPRARSQASVSERLEGQFIGVVSKLWPDFAAVHMTWGAINELTTLTSYKRLSVLADHPILSELLSRIMRDESRHFAFYFHQARLRLPRPGVGRVARWLVERFWAPVGSRVQPAEETLHLGRYLFAGSEGRLAAERVDETIRTLPGFTDVPLLEAWIDRALRDSDAQPGPTAVTSQLAA